MCHLNREIGPAKERNYMSWTAVKVKAIKYISQNINSKSRYSKIKVPEKALLMLNLVRDVAARNRLRLKGLFNSYVNSRLLG